MKKVFFLILLVSVIFSHEAGYAQNRSLWQKRQKTIGDVKKPAATATTETAPQPPSIDPEDIRIPEAYGTIIETRTGTNGKLIVHIQDAHMNYEGQKNAAEILQSLIESHGLDLILLEGKVSNRNFHYIRARAPLEERIEKADKLLKKGDINGVNYLNIATDYPMTILGIEDKGLYDSNINALWEIDKFKGPAAEYVDKLIRVSDLVKPRIYNEDLKELDEKKKDYDSETIDLVDYYEYLYNKSEESELPLYTFPNFNSLIKARRIEKEIDLTAITDGTATSEERDRYAEYQELTRELNINELFKEEPLLEDLLEDIFTKTSEQKDLLRVSNALSIMKNLLRIKVVPEEYKYFEDNRKDFNPEFWSGFLKDKAAKFNLVLDVPAASYILSDNISKIERFYGIAAERNDVFLKRVNAHMEDRNAEFSALIAGGFHTPSLTMLLKDAGYSYVVVSPRVTTATDDVLYRSALKSEWLAEIE